MDSNSQLNIPFSLGPQVTVQWGKRGESSLNLTFDSTTYFVILGKLLNLLVK